MASSLLLAFIASMVVFDISAIYCGPVVVLPLRPAVPASYPVQLHHLQARDRERHARVFKHNVSGSVNISVVYDIFPPHPGFYLTKVMLGTPPREFELLFDTGSDVTWAPCSSCIRCPRSIDGVPINSYDRGNSSTAEMVDCSHQLCTGLCSRQSNQCTYDITYGDGDEVTGYYVSDRVHFDMITRKLTSSESVIFGCTTHESGIITWNPYNGILGFGPGDVSIISQLSSQGLAPKVFSHCLKRDYNSGGVLALGEIVDPKTVYTPLVQAMHYNVDLHSIAVNGKILPIDPTIFSTSNDRGTLVDSGTTLAYLVEEAYDAFISAIYLVVSKSANPNVQVNAGKQYYVVSDSTSLVELFPPVSLNFAGGASMLLKPEEYLLNISNFKGVTRWQIAFRKAHGGYTVFGDIVLKEKIIVYDLARQRLGWANRDCSLPINVSVSFDKDEGGNRRHRNGSSSRDGCIKLLIGILLMQIILDYVI